MFNDTARSAQFTVAPGTFTTTDTLPLVLAAGRDFPNGAWSISGTSDQFAEPDLPGVYLVQVQLRCTASSTGNPTRGAVAIRRRDGLGAILTFGNAHEQRWSASASDIFYLTGSCIIDVNETSPGALAKIFLQGDTSIGTITVTDSGVNQNLNSSLLITYLGKSS